MQSKSKTAYTTLTSRSTLALGKTRTERLCAEVEIGLFEPGSDAQIETVLTVAGVDTSTRTAAELRTALKGTPTLVLEALAETWRPRTVPTRTDVFYQIKDVQHKITQTIERTRYELLTRTQTTTAA